MLEIKDLHVEVEGQPILKGVNLKFVEGKITALMGPNGSGKSTLANTIMGHPKYNVTKGNIILNGEDITELSPDERAKKGLFLSFQYPAEIPGVTIANVMKTALANIKGSPMPFLEFKKLLQEKMALLKMNEKFILRYLNDGFSGGEKKRTEILQLLMLDPNVAILDETDSGLDIDALRVVSEGVNAYMKPEKSILIITHYKRILELIKPDKLYILIDGKIALEGGGELVDQLEEKGYGWIEKQ
ncbi:MAG: Fe-S cluster assembly ATPase SufC [Candidatus Woesearchaeota archaeon]